MSLELMIPITWETVSMPDVAHLNMGQSPSSVDVNEVGEGLVFFQGKAEFGKLHPTARKFCTAPKKIAEKNDILLSVRAPVGPTNLADQTTAIGRGLAAIKPFNGLDYKYLFYYFQAIEPWMSEQGTGSTFKAISGQFLKELPVAIAPLAEQKQIASKLDELLAQVDTLKTRLDAIPAILKRFRQSVLAAAVSGRLTEEWREVIDSEPLNITLLLEEVATKRRELGIRTPKNTQSQFDSNSYSIPESWFWARLGSIAVKITDGAHNTPKLHSSGFPYLMAKDLTGGALDFSERRFISESDHRELYNKCKPEIGDLLVVNIGAGTGNNVLVDVDFEFSFKNIAIIKRPDFVEPKYLKWFFDARKGAIFDKQTRGGAQPFLSLTVLNSLEFALPPLKEQAEIVRCVERLFTYADQIEQRVKDAQSCVNILTQSILAKAFRGELTAEWREQNPDLISGENSAEALLNRIKAQRQTAPLKTRTRKKRA